VKLVYVTSRYPFGPGEAFLGTEIAAHLEAGCELAVFPAYPRGAVSHADARRFLGLVPPPSPLSDAGAFVRRVLPSPGALRRAGGTLLARQTPRIRAKNVAVLARLGSLVELLRRLRPDHVHVHWGGTSSTLAMTAAETVGIPWSLTLHRWDIYENNLLAAKLTASSFTRVISESAAGDVRRLVPGAETHVIHMGVDVPDVRAPLREDGAPRLVCIASLVPVKDHDTLLRAFAQADADATLELVGSGPLEPELRALAAALGIDGRVLFAGLVDHDRLLERLRAGDWDGAVLSSRASGTEHEGIPVSLMESMAAGVPAIATDSGATRELVTPTAGILVPPGDVEALAGALRRTASDAHLRAQLASGAVERVREGFDVRRIGEELRRLFAAAGRA
jgi:colanic acid/amylovoran biosynthesis glycosyltransferase